MAKEGLSGKIEASISSSEKSEVPISSLVPNEKVCKGEEVFEMSSRTFGKFNFSYFVVPNSLKEGEGEGEGEGKGEEE